jgi:hypothetical protein
LTMGNRAATTKSAIRLPVEGRVERADSRSIPLKIWLNRLYCIASARLAAVV